MSKHSHPYCLRWRDQSLGRDTRLNAPWGFAKRNGLTLVEVLIVVAIVGILAAAAISSWTTYLRRERVNAVTLALYGWLNEVRQSSLRLQGAGCTVTFSSGTVITNGVIASVNSATSPECFGLLGDKAVLPLNFSQTRGQALRIERSASTVVFTPRTLSTNSSDVVIGLVVSNRAPMRCLKILANSGSIQVGTSATESDAEEYGSCSYSLVRSL